MPPALIHPASPASVLHVAGNQLIDGAGQPVILRGVDVSGTEFACAQGGTATNAGWSIFGGQPEDTPATISAIQSWHVNAVRVPLNEDCWLGINGISATFGGDAYRTAITGFVRDLIDSGMYVIVDLHWNAPGTAVARSQQPMADEDHAPAFWRSVAYTFASSPNVMLDLYNEPFLYQSYFQNAKQDSWACWLNGCMLKQYLSGGQPYTKSYSWQAAGMQQLVDAVRATGARNILIANGLNWANDDSGWLAHRPNDPAGNLAAGWHEYEGEQCADVSCWARTIAPIAQRVPVIVGETGDHTGSGCVLVNLPSFLPWADSHGVSYLAWTFNPWGYTHDVLITNWKGTPSGCEGLFYAAHLAALAAKPAAPQNVQSPAFFVPNPVNVHGPSTPVAPVLYIALLAIGFIGVVLGVLIATNFVHPLISGAPRGLRDSALMLRIGQHRTSVGILIATCGAICFVFAKIALD